MSHSGDESLDEVMLYELFPYPSSVFEAKTLCKLDNPSLLEAFRNHTASVEVAVLQTVPKTEHCVIDGGSLLYRLKSAEGRTCRSFADDNENQSLKNEL